MKTIELIAHRTGNLRILEDCYRKRLDMNLYLIKQRDRYRREAKEMKFGYPSLVAERIEEIRRENWKETQQLNKMIRDVEKRQLKIDKLKSQINED